MGPFLLTFPIIRKVIILLAWFGMSLTHAQHGPPPAAVEVAKVEEKTMASNIWVPGTVVSLEDSKIASEVSGVLTFVVEVGEKIDKGQPLAQVNDRQLQLQIRHDQAELARLQSQLKFAQRQLERTISLSESNSTAQFRIDELEMEHDVLEQEIILAKVELDQTAYLLERSKIIAPFSGVVVERIHQPGEHIAIGEELLRLVNTKALEVSAQAPLEISRFVASNDPVTVKSKDNMVIGKLRSAVPVGDPKSRMIEVRVQLQGDWVIGDAVNVALNNGPDAKVIVVPRDAMVLRNKAVFVYKIHDGLAQQVKVEAGIGNDSNIAVVGDLITGDLVVTRGAERLRDGQQVEVLNEVANL